MAATYKVLVNGKIFQARQGQTLLDAALANGIPLPHDCRAGHCGTCCVRLVAGTVEGGKGTAPGIVHACQCKISGDAAFEQERPAALRQVGGTLTRLTPLSREVVEVEITTDRALPYLAGQYARVEFDGFPSRSYSLTHPIRGPSASRSIYLHVRLMPNGRVGSALGGRIRPGHRVMLTGPMGSAHYRPNTGSRLILTATNTGFAPIWSIAVAALRENPSRNMAVIVGGRTLDSLYMGPALAQLDTFPNVVVIAACSRAANLPPIVKPGRTTDFLPALLPGDEIYACGAQEMVETVKSIAAKSGAHCYADPFLAAGPVSAAATTPAPIANRSTSSVRYLNAQAARDVSLPWPKADNSNPELALAPTRRRIGL